MTVRTDAVCLPAEPDEFVGRERDTTEIIDLVTTTRLVTLAGPGGIGKSRLALRVALDYGEAAGVAPVPVAFVEMADLDAPDLVVPRVATTIGVSAEAGRGLEETLLDALRHRPMLLVLDNCEHLVEPCARLCSAVMSKSEGTRLLTTSREPLRIAGETVWRVPPLPVPAPGDDTGGAEAVRLFVARAAAARPEFRLDAASAPVVARICRVLEGMPLAIELAAARVRVLSAAQIAARLDDRFRLLASGDRTAPERLRTLWAAVDWSHELLGQAERVLLRRLSVFSGGWTLEMAERVCADAELPEADMLDRLADLVDKSLVVVAGEVAGEMRYRMLETIRQYAAGRLDAAGERDELRDRHLDCAAELTQSAWNDTLSSDPAGPDRVAELLDRAGTEQGNMQAAMAWSLESADLEPGLAICHVHTRGWWIPKGRNAEGVRWHERFMAALPADAVRERARLTVGCAELTFEMREYAAASRYASDGLELAVKAGDEERAAAAQCMLAALDSRAGRTEEAARRVTEAITVAERGGDPWNLALAYATAATVALASGAFGLVATRLEQALHVARRIGNGWLVGRMLIGQARLDDASGEPDDAIRRYTEARGLFAAYGATAEQARCHEGIARVALGRGDLDTARAEIGETLRLTELAGHGVATARGMAAAARLAAASGAAHDAVFLAAAADRLRRDLNAPPSGHHIRDVLDHANTELGAEEVTELWERGAAMTRPEAL
ncbi:MAG TPA: AAA family ATPase, partial [Streptosporangiaceae bacterium]